MKIENFKPCDINIKDERFRISYYFDLTHICHSIAKIGLIHPPVITYRNGEVLIVTGWKRILACRNLSLSLIPCFIFEGQEDLQAFRLAIGENIASRPFTLLEKAQILNRLIQLHVPENVLVKDDLPQLDIPPTLHHLDTHLRIAALDSETQALIHAKGMGVPAVQLLTELSEEERRLLMPFLKPLGQNKLREFLQNLLEISKRDRIPIKNFLAGNDIQKTVADQNLSPLQKAEEIRNQIQKQRYPNLSAWKETFASRKKDLDWPDDIRIEPSPFFEGDDFSVQFTFKDIDEYTTRLAQLNELASDAKVSQMLNFFLKRKDE